MRHAYALILLNAVITWNNLGRLIFSTSTKEVHTFIIRLARLPNYSCTYMYTYLLHIIIIGIYYLNLLSEKLDHAFAVFGLTKYWPYIWYILHKKESTIFSTYWDSLSIIVGIGIGFRNPECEKPEVGTW